MSVQCVRPSTLTHLSSQPHQPGTESPPTLTRAQGYAAAVRHSQGSSPQPGPHSTMLATTVRGDRSADAHSPLQAAFPSLLHKLGRDPDFPGWHKGEWEKSQWDQEGWLLS